MCLRAELPVRASAPRAPAGVMGDDVHHKGGWMVSYRYMAMHMEGIDGGDVSGYMMQPVEMDMQKHMVGAMAAPHDRITFALMVPYIIKDMEREREPVSIPSSERTEGVGDVRLAGIDYRPSGKFDGLRLVLERGAPLYQDLDGPQLEGE